MKKVIGLVILLSLFCVSTAFGEVYPTKPITVLSPFGSSPGSLHDAAIVFARVLGKKMGVEVNLVVNPELGNVTQYMSSKAPADGYTVMFGGFGPITLDVWYENLSYSPIDDLRMLGQLTWMPIVLYGAADAPFNDLDSFVKYAKANPGMKVGIGMPRGGSPEPSTAYFAKLAGIELTFSGEGVKELQEGKIQAFVFHPFGNQHKAVEDGIAIPLAVYTPMRLPYYPEAPTLIESGYPMAITSWRVAAVPKDTPEEVVQILVKAVEEVAHDPEFIAALLSPSHELPTWRGPEETETWIRAQLSAYEKIIDYVGLTGSREKKN